MTDPTMPQVVFKHNHTPTIPAYVRKVIGVRPHAITGDDVIKLMVQVFTPPKGSYHRAGDYVIWSYPLDHPAVKKLV